MKQRDQAPQDGNHNRDSGARPYADMPSVTDRQWGDSGGRDDSFGPPGLGGWGRFGAADGGGQQAADAASRRAGARAGGPRGRGPKNAQRSDSLVAEELNERFTEDDFLDASEILVGVEDGRVLLTGEVPERRMKHRAEDIAEAVRGVVDIENRIRVDDGMKSFGTGGAVRSGHSQQGSGFSSSPPNADWQPRDNRVD
jgi:hypothetical protein